MIDLKHLLFCFDFLMTQFKLLSLDMKAKLREIMLAWGGQWQDGIDLKLVFIRVLLKAKPSIKNLKLRAFSSRNMESQGGKGIYNISDDGQSTCMLTMPLINDCEVAQDRDWAQRKTEVQMAGCDPEVQGTKLCYKVTARREQRLFSFFLEQLLQEMLHRVVVIDLSLEHTFCFAPKFLQHECSLGDI